MKIAEALLKKARKGDVRAIAEVANRVEGKPFQSALVDVEPANRLAGLSDMELEETQEAIERLERELGYAPSEGPISVAQ